MRTTLPILKHLIALVALLSGVCAAAAEPPGSLADASRSTPVLPDDVLSVLSGLEGVYTHHPGFKHFIWEYVSQTPNLSLSFWRKFALHYYEHVRVFRLYLAGAMTVVPVEDFQVTLSEILADEFGVRLHGEPDVDGHPALFRRFMKSLGLTEDDWEKVSTGKNLLPGVAHYKKVHYSLFQSGLAEEIVGAIIFGMERTTPHRHSSVLVGLRDFSNRTGHVVDAQFFSEHVAVDDYHNTALIRPLESWFRDPVKVQRMREGALRSFDARREFLDNLAAELGVPKPSSKADSISGTALPLPAHVTWAADAFVGLGLRFAWLDAASLVPHEQTDPQQVRDLRSMLESTVGGAALPAIVADVDTLVVIDGHHRLSVLRSLASSKVPCLLLNYHYHGLSLNADDRISKAELIKQAVAAAALRPPKSTRHEIVDASGGRLPVEVLSPVVWVPITDKRASA